MQATSFIHQCLPRARLSAPALAVSATVFALLGCGGSTSNIAADITPAPTAAVPTMAAGAMLATVAGDSATVGSTFVNATGNGFIALSQDGDAATSALYVVNGTKARRVPAISSFTTLGFDRTEAATLTPLSASAAAGSYDSIVGDVPASFTVGSDGSISAGSSSCKLSGKIDFGNSYGGAFAVTLTLVNCGSASSATYNGIVLASPSNAPAAWQAIAENGSSVIDLLALR